MLNVLQHIVRHSLYNNNNCTILVVSALNGKSVAYTTS